MTKTSIIAKNTLLIFAFVLFSLGTFLGPTPATPSPWYSRFNIISAGLAFYTASILFP